MLNKIITLSELSGHSKIDYMKNHPSMKKVLYYAYNPFKKYYITAPESFGTDDPMAVDYIPYDFLNELAERKITGNDAFGKVCDWIVSMNYETAEVFKRIINKDLRAGVNIRSINKAFPGLIPLAYDGEVKPPVMLLKNYDEKKIKYPCLVAVKKDGVRGLYNQRILSRQGKKLIGHDHLEKEIDQYGVMLDGEICVPGLIFDDASGKIRDNSPTPESVIWLFDAPSIPGSKLDRYRWMKDNIKESNCVKVITHFIIKDECQLIKFYHYALSQGEEGIVIYDPDSLYEDKRSYDWMRMVPVGSEDCPVIGFYEGKGRLEGNLGGIIIDYKGKEVKVGSGFSDKLNKTELNQLVTDFEKNLATSINKKLEGYPLTSISVALCKLRKFIWDNKDKFLGQIAKVEYKEKTKAGSLRQPRFKGWRFDK